MSTAIEQHHPAPQVSGKASTFRDYMLLSKPSITRMCLIMTAGGMWLAPHAIDRLTAVCAMLGTAFTVAAANALNMWWDADIDAVMTRTAGRPVPAGRVPRAEAAAFGGFLSALSVALLALASNYLAAGLLAFTIFFYVVIYSMWLKRSTPQNIVIGGAAGALPPVVGWAAASGTAPLEPWVLFAIIFLWTPPHFWALALFRSGDYGRAGVPMMPVVKGEASTRRQIFAYALILAAIGLIESLLTLNLVGEITKQRGGASRECVAQGTANLVTGFFGGMGGCAMIGQSMINVKSGGRTRLSGIAAALFLLAFILFASPMIEQIPLAALVGVMFMVVIGTFAWQSFKIMRRIPLTDAFVIVLVTAVTVMHDLAVAVVVGVIVSALAYAWNNAKRIHAITRESHTEAGAKVYEIEGPLFFGSTDGFAEVFTPEEDPDVVIVDFMRSRVVDQSALQAIEDLAGKYEALDKTIRLRHLTRDCHQLLNRAGQLMVDSNDDPEYALAVDYSVRTGRFGGAH